MPDPTKAIMISTDFLQITMLPPVVVPTVIPPLPIVGTSSKTKVMMMPACLEGDELPPMLKSPQPYISPPYVVPGMGTFEIILKPDNKSSKTEESKKYLLKGTVFDAKFSVTVPAQLITPAGPQTDPVSTKMGKCQFITKNTMVECS